MMTKKARTAAIERLQARVNELEVEIKWAAYSGQLDYRFFTTKILPALNDVKGLAHGL